jgi:hypothetical protein
MGPHRIKAKTGKQLRDEREKRIMDAIQLRIPDRVPVHCPMGYFPAKYTGIPFSAAYYDFDAWYEAYKKTLEDFQPDMIFPQGFMPGKALEIIDPEQMRWPGHGLRPNLGHQTIEVDFMEADEYELFLADSSDFMLRKYLSRTSNNLEGLTKLPTLWELAHVPMPFLVMADSMAQKEVTTALNTLIKAGRELKKWRGKIAKFNKLIYDMGYPQYTHGAALPPFDIISHTLRGMRGTMVDMFRQPEKILETCELIYRQTLLRPMPSPNEYGNIRYFMTVTRGSDDFLSRKQYETFYWPTFKKLVMSLIDRGVTPCIFFEGNCNSRMEYLLDFPKGKILARLDSTDIFRAKEILKGHTCIEGNVPVTLLQVGTVQDVKDYCKKLINTIGKGGGYILSTRSSTDEVNPENLKAMIESTKEHDIYN